MGNFTDLIDTDGLFSLIESIKNLIQSLINFFGQLFGWLGPEILIILGIGAAVAIVLRIIGR